MSHLRVKTKFNVEDAYGTTSEQTLYVHHNNTVDYVSVYDNDGKLLFYYPDTIDNNLLDAIIRACLEPFDDDNSTLKPGVEYMDEEDQKKCKF